MDNICDFAWKFEARTHSGLWLLPISQEPLDVANLVRRAETYWAPPAIEGLSTPKGIEEYLILLSVCQTCKYSQLDFLDFLRSGETDVGTFTASQSN